MNIEVTGNINFYLENKTPDFKTYSVSGNWGLNYFQHEIFWKMNNQSLGSLNGEAFYKMCQEIQGKEYSTIETIFKNYRINFPKKEMSIQELDLIKALANLFLWFQYFFINEIGHENESFHIKVFDEFIIDNTKSLGIQKDIYLLPKKYQSDSYAQKIKYLEQLNLLTYLKISNNDDIYINHFIPFSKPGYKKDVFNDEETYNLWKSILSDRNNRLNNFFNLR